LILYDPALIMDFHDYGIMLPIAPDRGKRVLEFMGVNCNSGGDTAPYPGPVFNIAGAMAFLGIAGDCKTNTPPSLPNSLITREDLERIHQKEFIASLYSDAGEKALEAALLVTFELIDAQGRLHRYEPERAKRPLADLFHTILAQVGGTWLACRLALAADSGFCYYLGGGMHHARYDSGSGFCLVNDVAIAAVKILFEKICDKTHSANSEKPVRLIWIIDMDVHKGDGTAELIRFARERGELQTPGSDALRKPNGADSEKPCILTLSIHMARGWPLDEENLAAAKEGRSPLLPSDIDIGIEAGQEGEYTPRLAEGIRELERLSAALYLHPGAEIKPDLALVVDGADPYEHDELPSSILLKLTLEQCLARDNYVYHYLMDRRIPSAWIQSGGYGSRAWEPPAHFLMGAKNGRR